MKWYKWKYTIHFKGEELRGTFRSLGARNYQEAKRVLEMNYGIGCVISLEEKQGRNNHGRTPATNH
ncbi:hypothetical protein D3C78_1959820 [compost metagenome]